MTTGSLARGPAAPSLHWLLMKVKQAADAVVSSIAVDADSLVSDLFASDGVALVRMARLFTDDRNAAEDLVQEAFIRLHKSAHRIRSQDKAAPYLRSIVINLARDHNRRGLMSLRHQEAGPTLGEAAQPEDRLLLTETEEMLLEAVRELPPRQRDCILLRFYLELSQREIADALSISANSVKTHTKRALQTLRANSAIEL